MNNQVNLVEILRHDDNFQTIVCNMLQSIFEVSFDGVMITEAGPAYSIIYVNPALCAITGYSFSELLGKSPSILQGERTDKEVLVDLKEKLDRGETFHGRAFNYRKNGEKFLMEWKIVPIKNKAGVVSHFFSIQREIAQEGKTFQKPNLQLAEND